MINSEYSNSASKSLITAANEFIENEKIDQRVTLITDFLDEEKSLALLQKAHLLVFPYQEGDGPSAAVRMGIASGVPVAVTPLPTFDDLEDVVFRLPGIDPQSVAIGLEQILNNEKALAEMKAKAAQWSDERLIPRVSKKFFHLISS